MWRSVLFTVVFVVGLGERQINGAAIHEEIFRGFNAVRGQFPYQTLQIQQDLNGGYAFCGGSLISTRWILTAAHCAYQKNYTTVYVGMVNTQNSTGVTQYTVPKANHYVHPQYNPTTINNDIALLKLPTTVTTSQYVSIIQLPKKAQANSSTFDNKMATASGWGHTTDDEIGIHQILQFNTIHVFPHSQCKFLYQSVNAVTDGMLCTDKTVYSGPCPGDSGGPLTVNGTDGRPVVIGAASWIVGNCSNSYPAVFVNVANYLTWINSVSGVAIS